MDQPKYHVAVRMNNVKHAFPGELSFVSHFGSATIKDAAIRDNQGGNTSASLVVRNNSGMVVFHVLVDAGMGTISSIAQAADFGFPKRMDLILITHGDIDHHSELVYACQIPMRFSERRIGEFGETSGRPQPRPIPIYAAESAAKKLANVYSFAMACPELATTDDERKKMENKAKTGWIHLVRGLQPTEGGKRKPSVNEGPDKQHQFLVTPVGGVGHRNCVLYVVEFKWSEREPRKIVFAWDMQHLPWKKNALNAKQLLSGADLMFVEMNTCRSRRTGHISYEQVRAFVRETRPKECYVVHYSGFEDTFPKDNRTETEKIMSLDQLDVWLDRQSERSLPKVRAARPGAWYPSPRGWDW